MPKFLLEIDLPDRPNGAADHVIAALEKARNGFVMQGRNSGSLALGDFDGAWSFQNTEAEDFSGSVPCVHCGPNCQGACSSRPDHLSSYHYRQQEAAVRLRVEQVRRSNEESGFTGFSRY